LPLGCNFHRIDCTEERILKEREEEKDELDSETRITMKKKKEVPKEDP
jgi:hypothetical protein